MRLCRSGAVVGRNSFAYIVVDADNNRPAEIRVDILSYRRLCDDRQHNPNARLLAKCKTSGSLLRGRHSSAAPNDLSLRVSFDGWRLTIQPALHKATPALENMTLPTAEEWILDLLAAASLEESGNASIATSTVGFPLDCTAGADGMTAYDRVMIDNGGGGADTTHERASRARKISASACRDVDGRG